MHLIPINEDMGVVGKYIGSASEEASNRSLSVGAEGGPSRHCDQIALEGTQEAAFIITWLIGKIKALQ